MTDLYGDDAMALNLFRKAADALVAKSELGAAVTQLQDSLNRIEAELRYVKEQRDSANSAINVLQQRVDQYAHELHEQKDLVADQKRQIDQLANENEALNNSLSNTMQERDSARSERDRWMQEYEQADTFRKTAEDKLRTIQQALGNGVPEVTQPDTFRGDLPAESPTPTSEPRRDGDPERFGYGVEPANNPPQQEAPHNNEGATPAPSTSEPNPQPSADHENRPYWAS